MKLEKLCLSICPVIFLAILMAGYQQGTTPTLKVEPTVVLPTDPAPIPLLTDIQVVITPTPGDIHLPDGLINIGSYWDECDPIKPSQTWLFPYPYHQGQVLISDSKINFRAPTLSPDGEWLAYIRSDPAYIEWMQGIPESLGTDSIWVLRPDGSDARQISADFQAWNYIDHTGFCVGYGSFIDPWWGLEWSKNGNFISFRFISTIAPAVQENTQVISLADNSALRAIEIPGIGALWSPLTDQLISMEVDHVSLYEFTEQGIRLSLQSQYPSTSFADHRLAWPSTRKYPLIIFTKQLPDVPYEYLFEI